MPATDSEEYRAASREGWSASAGAWGVHRGVMQAAGEPVSHWIFDDTTGALGNAAPKGASLSFKVLK